MQERHIKNIEEVLEKASISHQQLRNRVEAVEMDGIRIRENYLSKDAKKVRVAGEGYESTPKFGRAVRSLNREPTMRMRKKGMTTMMHANTNIDRNTPARKESRMRTEDDDTEGEKTSTARRSKDNITKDSNPKILSFAGMIESPRVNEATANIIREIENELAATTKEPSNINVFLQKLSLNPIGS